MVKIIRLQEVQKDTKDFYEICSDIGIVQKELEQMIMAIEKNARDFKSGRISKDLFRYNDSRMKKESAKKIKGINDLIGKGISMIAKIGKEIESQKIVEKKGKKKNRLAGIKKKGAKKKVAQIPGPAPIEPAPEQKAQQGS